MGSLMSAIADLAKVMQIVLDPERSNSVISPYSLREAYAWVDGRHDGGLFAMGDYTPTVGEFMGHFSFNLTSYLTFCTK